MLASKVDRPIVVAGEALVDLLVDTKGAVEAHNGGGPFNAARTIARLDQPVMFLGRLSDDVFGRGLRAALETDGVIVPPGLATDLPTTLAQAEISRKGNATYRFYVADTSAPNLELEIVEAVLPERVHSLHVGTLGLVFEPSASTLLSLLDRMSGSALLSLDPNCRPHAISDLASYRQVIEAATIRADLVKLSEDDAEVLAPGREPTATARAILDRGPQLAILTRGHRGALALGRGWELEVPAPEVDTVDTVGAGDAFSGAFLAFFRSRGWGAEELQDADAVLAAIRFATTVSAVVCARAGADPPYLADLCGLERLEPA